MDNINKLGIQVKNEELNLIDSITTYKIQPPIKLTRQYYTYDTTFSKQYLKVILIQKYLKVLLTLQKLKGIIEPLT
jgi:hypothetical protein